MLNRQEALSKTPGTWGLDGSVSLGCLVVMSCQVEEKNNRIHEILVDLGSDETFFRPKWLDAEQPEEVFNVRLLVA